MSGEEHTPSVALPGLSLPGQRLSSPWQRFSVSPPGPPWAGFCRTHWGIAGDSCRGKCMKVEDAWKSKMHENLSGIFQGSVCPSHTPLKRVIRRQSGAGPGHSCAVRRTSRCSLAGPYWLFPHSYLGLSLSQSVCRITNRSPQSVFGFKHCHW